MGGLTEAMPLRGPDSDPQISVAVGITVGLIASLVQSLGLTIQRKSHILNQSQPEDQRKPDYRRSLWLIGFSIFFISNILGSVFQIASLPVVILAPLGAVSLLWNAFFARFLLGDEFSRFMILGTLLIVAGAILIGFYGIVPEPTHSLDDLLRLFGRKSFVVYFTLLGVAVLSILIVTHITEWAYKRRHRIQLTSAPSSPHLAPHMRLPSSIPMSSPSLPTDVSESTPLVVDLKYGSLSPSLSFMTLPPSRTPTLVAISYASISGLLSGMCLLFAKSGVELLVLTVAGNNQFGHWQSWALVVGLVALALLQLWYLHKSLVLEDPTLVCPLAFCSYNLSSILNGLIYFDQYDSLSAKQVCLVMLGICILLGGVWALSQQDEVDDVEGGTEEITSADGGPHQGGWGTGVILGEDMNLTPPSSPMSPLSGRPLPTSEGRESVSDVGKLASGRRAASSPASFMFPSSSSSMMPIEVEGSTFFSDDAGMVQPPTRQAPLSVSQTSAQQTSTTRRYRRRSTVRFSPTLDAAGGVGGESGHGGTPLVGGFAIGLSPLSPGFSLAPRPRRPDSEASQVGQQHGEGEREQRGAEMNLAEDQDRGERSGIMRRRWNGLRRIIRRER